MEAKLFASLKQLRRIKETLGSYLQVTERKKKLYRMLIPVVYTNFLVMFSYAISEFSCASVSNRV